MAKDTIVVGVDGSVQARTALRWASDLARSSGNRLVGVHVLFWPPDRDVYAYSVMADTIYRDPNQIDEVYREPSEQAFAELDPEPGWILRFAQGHPGRVLVEESRDARMLVLGAREHTGVMRLLAGSTGHYCLNHVVCPVVSVPAGGPEEPATSPGAEDLRAPAPQA